MTRLATPAAVAQSDATATNGSVSVNNTTSTTLFAANKFRIEFTVCNPDATNAIFLSLGAAAATNTGIRIPAGQSYTNNSWLGSVTCFQSSGGTLTIPCVEIA